MRSYTPSLAKDPSFLDASDNLLDDGLEVEQGGSEQLESVLESLAVLLVVAHPLSSLDASEEQLTLIGEDGADGLLAHGGEDVVDRLEDFAELLFRLSSNLRVTAGCGARSQ